MDLLTPAYHSTFALVLIVLLFPAAAVLAWWSYRKPISLSIPLRYTLMILRCLAIWIILIVLLNPVIKMTRSWEVKPDIAVLLDNSASMTIKKGDYQGIPDYRSVLNALQLSDTSHIRYHTFAFSRNVHAAPPGSLAFNGENTDLDAALRSVSRQGEPYNAIILVSDGISTYGADPTNTVNRLTIPVFTIATGDTTHERDIVVENIVHPDKSYKNTPTPLDVTILNDGFPDDRLDVQLIRNNEIIDHKTIRTKGKKSAVTVHFSVKPVETGLHQYEIRVPALSGERNTRNNHRFVTLKVLKNQIRILHLAFEIYPDVKTVRSILEEDKGIKLSTRTWVSGDTFIGGNLPAKPDSLDVVILQGYPDSSVPQKVRKQVQKLIQNKPVILLATPRTDITDAGPSLRSVLPLDVPPGTPSMRISIQKNAKEEGHPVLDLPAIDQGNVPAMYGPIKNVKAAAGAHDLFDAVYHDQDTHTPVLALRTLGNRRIAEMLAFGYFHWYQQPGSTRDFVIKLINNLVQWTATSPDNRLLRLKPTQPVYNQTESVAFTALLNNQNGRPEDQAIIELTIDGDQYESRHFTMTHSGTGQYDLQVGKLPEGHYHYHAVARRQKVILGKANGEFIIGTKGTEFVNTDRNDALMSYIAKTTGGGFYTWQNASEVLPAMRSRGLLQTTQKTENTSLPLHQSPWWLVAALILLTGEWTIRKVKAL